jgi:PPM family protein phosphatase
LAVTKLSHRLLPIEHSAKNLMNCHQCGGAVTESDRFCEECGANLQPTPAPSQIISNTCQKCRAPADRIDSDRYCLECGFRQVELTNDPIELQPAPNLAGASDRGRRHHQNEDAIALKVIDPETYILVVCDGVSSSQHPELASQAAITACADAIAVAVQQGVDANNAICRGIAAALTSVAQIPFDPHEPEDPSSATIVTALVQSGIATIGWLGDSRAYWIAANKSLQLTEDDSWVREAIAAGQITTEAAETSPHAHAITRWLGADTIDDGKPNLMTFKIPGEGYLLLCSDGLWNYAPDPTDLYHLVQQAGDPSPLAISHHLIRYANQRGGQDNITVGILRINDLPQPLGTGGE